MFSKYKAEAGQKDNPNWWEDNNGTFHDEYWKEACT